MLFLVFWVVLLLARQALYHLSHSTIPVYALNRRKRFVFVFVVFDGGD
jgi:hypothetical protein